MDALPRGKWRTTTSETFQPAIRQRAKISSPTKLIRCRISSFCAASRRKARHPPLMSWRGEPRTHFESVLRPMYGRPSTGSMICPAHRFAISVTSKCERAYASRRAYAVAASSSRPTL
jgi:hypothetical protein